MAALDDILNILQGIKVYDSASGLWRVYDQNGVELADPGGVLLRGLHGFLLRQFVIEATVAAGGVSRKRKSSKVFIEEDGEILVFQSAAAAAEYINANKVTSVDFKKKKKPRKVEPVRIPIEEADIYLEKFGYDFTVRQLVSLGDIETLLMIAKKVIEWQEDEDILILLLAA